MVFPPLIDATVALPKRGAGAPGRIHLGKLDGVFRPGPQLAGRGYTEEHVLLTVDVFHPRTRPRCASGA